MYIKKLAGKCNVNFLWDSFEQQEKISTRIFAVSSAGPSIGIEVRLCSDCQAYRNSFRRETVVNVFHSEWEMPPKKAAERSILPSVAF